MFATEISNRGCSVLKVSNDGEKHRKAYSNSETGRADFMTECADVENYDEVLEAWGNKPTVFPDPAATGESLPSDAERITALEQALTAIEEGIASV